MLPYLYKSHTCHIKMKTIFYKKDHIYTKFLCHSNTKLKTKTKFAVGFVGVLSVVAGVQAHNFAAQEVAAENTTFQVNVVESLSVAITTPSTWASGNPNTFLRNDVGLSVTTNNAAGFTASMYANTGSSDSTNTSLVNTSNQALLPTMSESQARGSFSANQWGYSLDTTDTTSSKTYNNKIYNETNAGNNDSNYYPLGNSSNPATVLTGTNTGSRTIYFGAKADISQAAGTYEGTVVIGVVTGVQNTNNDSSNPVTPVTPADNPAKPSDTTTNNPSYSTTYGPQSNQSWTVYNQTSSTATTTTETTTVDNGDTRSSYQPPAGVTESVASDVNVNSSSPLATGLAAAAGVSAAAGAVFFVLAKRKQDDEEQQQQQ